MKHTNRDLKNNIEAQDHKMNEFATSFWQVGDRLGYIPKMFIYIIKDIDHI